MQPGIFLQKPTCSSSIPKSIQLLGKPIPVNISKALTVPFLETKSFLPNLEDWEA
jgi:hypothetical protein